MNKMTDIQHLSIGETFYYHSDHLGSAAYLTYHGGVVQTLNYLPYGEDWVELNFFAPHDTTRLGIYRFNGKEKDYESGFHYFGARYYWSELLTGWLSVDPMADRYPSISPYAYCAWNPVKLIDPDGRIIDSASVTQNIKNMIDPTHECYNAEFAAIYQCLDDDKSTTYRFEKWDSFHKNNKNQDISGAVSLSEDNTLIIGYTWGLETALDGGIAPERALCEETRHAKQFCDGEFGFFKTPSTPWMVCGLVDEEEAHAWAARVSGSTPRYDLSHYNIDRTAASAEHAWVNDYKEKRAGTTPNYNANRLYSSEF